MSGGWSGATENVHADSQKLTLDVLVGLASGVVAGMAAFVYVNTPATVFASEELAVVLMLAAGALGASFTDSLRRSIVIFFIGWSAGVAVLAASLVAPVYYFPYATPAHNVLVSFLARDALGWVVMIYTPAYVGAYFLTLVAFSLRE